MYRVEKAEETRAKLVKRAMEGEEVEELSWDVGDDDVDDEDNEIKSNVELQKGVEDNERKVESLQLGHDDKPSVSKVKSEAVDVDRHGALEGRLEENDSSGEKLESKSDDRGSLEGRNDNISEFPVVSSQPSEVDIGWDEIEDIGSGDKRKLASRGSPETVDLRKRLF